jgi:hypothetical protein
MQGITNAEKNKLNSFPAFETSTLTIEGWVNNSQTVNVIGITVNSNLIVSPPSTDKEFIAYCESKIRVTTQGAGIITFVCTTTPTIELIANIIILA